MSLAVTQTLHHFTRTHIVTGLLPLRFHLRVTKWVFCMILLLKKGTKRGISSLLGYVSDSWGRGVSNMFLVWVRRQTCTHYPFSYCLPTPMKIQKFPILWFEKWNSGQTSYSKWIAGSMVQCFLYRQIFFAQDEAASADFFFWLYLTFQKDMLGNGPDHLRYGRTTTNSQSQKSMMLSSPFPSSSGAVWAAV